MTRKTHLQILVSVARQKETPKTLEVQFPMDPPMAVLLHGWLSWERGAAPSPAQVGLTVSIISLTHVFLVLQGANNNVILSGVGSFQQYYEVGPLKNYSSSTIAWIPSLQFFFLFALGPIVGILFDKHGPRPLIVGGTLLHVFGLMMASLAKTYYQFILSQGVCSAIGVACIYSPGKSNLFVLSSPSC